MGMIRKAIIPAAGRGTRLLPATVYVAKELLPVGRKPMVQWALEEAAEAGVEEALLVVSKEKVGAFRAYFSAAQRSEFAGVPAMRRVRALQERMRITYVFQNESRGLGDAILQAREHVDGEPVLVLLPDNVLFGGAGAARQLIRGYEEFGRTVLGLLRVTPDRAAQFGNCGGVTCNRWDEGLFEITHLQDKGPGVFQMGGETSRLRVCGRYLLEPGFFEVAAAMPAKTGEFDDVPILQKLIEQGSVSGAELDGTLFDCGHWDGYWAANQFYEEHKELWN